MAAHLSVVHPPPAQQRPRRLIRSAVRRVWPRDLVVRVEPGCPPGWRVGPPDFVGVGAQKAGTSWWHRLISEHPSVALRPDQAKELHYFDSFFDRPFTRADAARYHGFFPRPYGAKSGEWTPRYLTDFWAHEQLRMAAPEAGIIVLLRDPVDRYRSGLTHELNEGARRRPTLALEASTAGSTTGSSPPCSATSRASRCWSCSTRRAAGTHSLNWSALTSSSVSTTYTIGPRASVRRSTRRRLRNTTCRHRSAISWSACTRPTWLLC